MFKPSSTDALLVIDLQNDFMPNGALAVPHGDEVLPVVNQLSQLFKHVILTQDWHPHDHISFAKQPDQLFSTVSVAYGEQVLWPSHCVQGSRGADFHQNLHIPHAALILRKGCHPQIDSYSAFVEADQSTRTGLAGYLHEKGIKRLFCVGLATDYCVMWSALDAKQAGFDVYVILDACRGIDLNGSLDKARLKLQEAGVVLIDAAQLALISS